MPRVALATADFVPDCAGDGPPAVEALAGLGIACDIAVWDEPRDWAAYDAVVIRSTWDYTQRREEFLRWVDDIAAARPLANPADVLRWNSDKHYLEDLRRAGVPVIPTAWLEPGDVPSEQWPEWDDLVVKPAVSAGARDSARYGVALRAAAQAHATTILAGGRSVMLQPFVPSVDRVGEVGVYLLGGEPSHAVRKGGVLHRDVPPVAGVELAETQSVVAVEPTPDEVAFARSVLAAVPHDGPLLYARVDVVMAPDGSPWLIELEAVEPCLFLPLAPHAAPAYAAAIADWLG